MSKYKIMFKEKENKRWLNWNKSKYRKPHIETYSKEHADKLVNSLKKTWRNDFKVVKVK